MKGTNAVVLVLAFRLSSLPHTDLALHGNDPLTPLHALMAD